MHSCNILDFVQSGEQNPYFINQVDVSKWVMLGVVRNIYLLWVSDVRMQLRSESHLMEMNLI